MYGTGLEARLLVEYECRIYVELTQTAFAIGTDKIPLVGPRHVDLACRAVDLIPEIFRFSERAVFIRNKVNVKHAHAVRPVRCEKETVKVFGGEERHILVTGIK